MLFKKKEPVFEMRLEKYWDDHEAKEMYRLVKYEIIKGKVDRSFYWLGGGDKEWANKTSKHYGLKVTSPIFEDI